MQARQAEARGRNQGIVVASDNPGSPMQATTGIAMRKRIGTGDFGSEVPSLHKRFIPEMEKHRYKNDMMDGAIILQGKRQ